MPNNYTVIDAKQPTWKEYLEHLRRDLERAQAALDYGPQDEATLAAFEYARTKYAGYVVAASQHEEHELVPDVMILDVEVTPPRPAEFIELNLVLTPDGTKFEEPIKPLEGEYPDLGFIGEARDKVISSMGIPHYGGHPDPVGHTGAVGPSGSWDKGATGETGTEGCPTGPTGRTS